MLSFNLSTLRSDRDTRQAALNDSAGVSFPFPYCAFDAAKPSGILTWRSIERPDGSQQQVAQITVDSYGRGWEAVKEWLLECVDSLTDAGYSDKTQAERKLTSQAAKKLKHLPYIAEQCKVSLDRSTDPCRDQQTLFEQGREWAKMYQAAAAWSGDKATAVRSQVLLAYTTAFNYQAEQTTPEITKAKRQLEPYTLAPIASADYEQALCCAATVHLYCAKVELAAASSVTADDWKAHLANAECSLASAKACLNVGENVGGGALSDLRAAVSQMDDRIISRARVQ